MKTINISDDSYLFLKELCHELKTQDNRATDKPFFVVMEDEKLFGMHPDYSDKIAYVDMGDCNLTYETKEEAMLAIKDNDYITEEEAEKYFDENITRTGYRHLKKVYNFFLTEKGYKEHMLQNKHNYNSDTYSYVECAYRNPEYDSLIKAIKEIGSQEDTHVPNT